MSASLPIDAAVSVRRIRSSDLDWAMKAGWSDFNAKRGDIVVIAVLYPLIALVAAALTLNDQLMPLFFPLVSGLSIMGPAVAAGFYELARRREQGLDSSWFHFLDPLKGRSRTPLVVLTLVLGLLFLAWQGAAWAIYASTLGLDPPTGIMDFFTRLFTTPEGLTMIALGNAAGFGFAVLTLILTVVSFPMIVDRPVGAGTAISTSLKAVARNPVTISLWGIRVGFMLALASLPVFLGLPIILPVLGYATWHLYTRLVER